MLLIRFHNDLLCTNAIEGFKIFSFYRLEGSAQFNHNNTSDFHFIFILSRLFVLCNSTVFFQCQIGKNGFFDAGAISQTAASQ